MKRFAQALTAVATISLSACSNAAGDGATEPTVKAEQSPERFQTLWTGYTALARTIDPRWSPTNADEANEAAGLTSDSSLHYVDMGPAHNGGKWCIESNDDTYLAFTYGDGRSTIRMGDHDCTYDDAQALVVGDFMTAEWTRGADLMGDVVAGPARS